MVILTILFIFSFYFNFNFNSFFFRLESRLAHIPYVTTTERKDAHGTIQVFVDPKKDRWTREIIKEISDYVHVENHYLRALKSQLQQSAHLLANGAQIILKSHIPGPTLIEGKATYIVPSNGENLGIVVDGFTNPHQDVKLNWNDGSVSRINCLHPFYDPAAYIVLFPHGSPGFHENIPLKESNKNRSTVTVRDYHAHQFHERWNENWEDEFNPVNLHEFYVNFSINLRFCTRETYLNNMQSTATQNSFTKVCRTTLY